MDARERVINLVDAWLTIGRTCPLDMQADIERVIIAAEETKAREEQEVYIKLSGLIADRVWDYCQAVQQGAGKAMMAQREREEIKEIIINTIRARSEGEKKEKED